MSRPVAPDPEQDFGAPPGADRRLSFGQAAADYDRYRPQYAPAALSWALGADPLRVVDLGAGTGLMSEVLLRLGHNVIAVEPDPGMRTALRDRLQGRADVHDGAAEAIPIGDASVDAVVVGQAFHWFDLPRALPELARVLVPGGLLVIAWNVRDDDVDWVRELSAIVGARDARSGSRDEGMPDIAAMFVDLDRATFPHQQQLDVDRLVGLVDTYSYVRLSPHRDEVLTAVRTLAAQHPQLAGLASFPLPYETVVYRCRVAALSR